MDGIRAIDHSDTAIEQEDDQQPSAAQPFPGGFLDGVKDQKLETVFDLMKKRVANKYELGDIKGLEARGFDQYPTQSQPTSRPALPELAKEVFNFLLDKQSETPATITDKEALKKLLCQLEGGGAVPGPRAYISVLGRYNVGKSTLLNALLSFDVLPTSEDAETAVTVFVQHQEIEIPELCKMSDGEVLRRGAEDIKTYLEEIQQKVREKELSKNLTEYLVRLPIPCFTRMQESKTMAITPLLVDTPGSNEVSQDDLRKLAHLNLQTATAYIYVMSFNELRNQHDYTAFQHIQERDEAIFNEGRIAIVVTKMDESYRSVKKDDRKLTESKVKQIVSSGIQKALKLDDVSPGIVYPLSGDFAFQARVARRDSGSNEIVDVMRTSWGNMKRATFGHKAFSIAGSMTSQELCEDLEMSSQISSVENKIRLMIDHLDALWQKSIASNCYLYINQALQTLDDAITRVGHQVAAFKARVDQCRDIKRHYDAITESLTSRTDFIEKLEDSYAADTDTEKMLSGKFREHLDSFMKTVRTKIKAGNYTPKQLEADLKVIHEEANEKLTHLCWQTTFNRCQQTLVSHVVTMTDKYGRMRNALAEVCNQASGNESLPQKSRPVPDCVENRVRDTAPRLDQIPKQKIEVSVGRWLVYAACQLLLGIPHIQLIKEEALGPIEEDIKSVVRNQHMDFFKERKDSVVLHFFVQYCKEMINLMDMLFVEYYNCPVGLSDIADQAHSELKKKEELQDQYRRWKIVLMKWRSHMTVFHKDLLPQKEDD